MARKFVLIDPSISDTAGHYYEYAVHVLNAADRAGYQTHLATNRKFTSASESQSDSLWSIHPVYKYGFWSPMRTRTLFSRLIAWWSGRWFQVRCAFRFSSFGVAWALLNNFTEFLLQQPVSWTSVRSLVALTPLVWLLKLARFGVMLALLPFAAVLFLLRPLPRLINLAPVKRYLRMLFADFTGLYEFLALVALRRGEIAEWVRQFRCLRRFTSDTRRLFARVSVGEGDILFLPTVSAIELMGLTAFIASSPAVAGASWSLLFRRDLYRGPIIQNPAEEQSVDALRRVFQNCVTRLAGKTVHFYTDTEELTAQYNQLGGAVFRTLPIPHTHRPVERDPLRRPLRAVYSGDARREKGYHHLPHVIQDLWSDYVETGKVEFALQSNYNVEGGEPEAVIARNQLEHFPGRGVQLLKEPLSSAGYQALLLSGDIHLLLYDTANYYARSSGILVEALSAGLPVLVPAGSWLARQFLGGYYNYQLSLPDQLCRVVSKDGSRIRWRLHGNPSVNPCSAGELTATEQGKAFCWLRIPAGADQLMISFRANKNLTAVIVYVDQLDEKRKPAATMIPLLLDAEPELGTAVGLIALAPGAVRIWLAFGSRYANSQISVSDIAIDFLSTPQNVKRPPTGAVGLIYHDPFEIPALLRELIDEFPHYRRSALEFAGQWTAHHNAGRLVAELAAGAGQPPATSQVPLSAAV